MSNLSWAKELLSGEESWCAESVADEMDKRDLKIERLKKKAEKNKELLQKILKRSRWDSQDGYPSYMGDGVWTFVSTSLGGVTPEELNKLFEIAELVPDKIISNGSCEECHHSVNGRERGYKKPCVLARDQNMIILLKKTCITNLL